MGMTFYMRSIAPDILEELITNQGVEDESWLEEPGTLYLEKSWEELLLALTGKDKRTESPLTWAFLGKMALEEGEGFNPEDDIYLGYTYYLEADDVKEVWNVLSEIPPRKLRKCLATQALTQTEAEPEPEETSLNEDKVTDYLIPYYKDFRQYYKQAAKKGNAMIMSIG